MPEKNSPERLRAEVVNTLRWELVGPQEEEEFLAEYPALRYSAGVLFPSSEPINELEESIDESQEDLAAEIEDEDDSEPVKTRGGTGGNEEDPEAAYDTSVPLANAYCPSAMGVSFAVSEECDSLQVKVSAATYSPEKREEKIKEKTITVQGHRRKPGSFEVLVGLNGEPKKRIISVKEQLCEGLRLHSLIRRQSGGRKLITMTLLNTSSNEKSEECKRNFFQCGFKVTDKEGRAVFPEYHTPTVLKHDEEQLNLELLYRNRKYFGVGHGCSVNWGEETDGYTDRIETDTLPMISIPPLLPRESKADEYSMFFLSGAEGEVSPADIIAKLPAIEEDYSNWIKQQTARLDSLSPELKEVARTNLKNCTECLARIKAGIELLSEDDLVLDAFMLANRVLLKQQYHSRLKTRNLSEAWEPEPQSYRPSHEAAGRWRCFQLAFILMNLPSLLSRGDKGDSDPRNIVDLIWFPTGGGKTEAYLGLAACTIFIRRLIKPSNVGCSVLMRYTLRLLTSQQFERASAMISAMELERQKQPDRLGDVPISIGLWVGESLTPNRRQDAKSNLNGWQRGKEELKFPLLTCPWCKTRLNEAASPGYLRDGNPRTVRARCPEHRCRFSKADNNIPALFVDEDIYDNPSDLIVGTVDKFAMLAWNEDAGSIFGLGKDTDGLDLIIQDELHLISGPLGSMVGLYETVIDLLASHGGRPPKIVASTATIRNAAEQCRGLYDRRVQIFPPAAIDAEDSYFAVQQNDAVSRMYVGVMGTAASSTLTLARRVIASLLFAGAFAGGKEVEGRERDPYWTLLWYFNSLRELGQACTLVQADVVEHLRILARRAESDEAQRRYVSNVIELTSRLSQDEIPTALKKLEVVYPDRGAVDVALASNMISVGMDIPRLGLMVVNGQPKTTAEYIQASSRVGRSKDAPGLVVTMYNNGKPRDRSHFENFRSYHEAFYKYVEPQSITPFSLPAIDRALHALLIITQRHLEGIKTPSEFDVESGELKRLVDFIIRRCERVDPAHVQYLNNKIEGLTKYWKEVSPMEWGKVGGEVDLEAALALMTTQVLSEVNDDSWLTPTSMRNVDVGCAAELVTRYGSSRDTPGSDESDNAGRGE